jgi:hypothetical protein
MVTTPDTSRRTSLVCIRALAVRCAGASTARPRVSYPFANLIMADLVDRITATHMGSSWGTNATKRVHPGRLTGGLT